MISDESDLTDLDELDEDYGAKSSKRKGKGKGKASAKDGYRLHNTLRPPRATTYSTESLYKQIMHQNINLEPDYQREVVWTEAKQTKLIDSIFRNFYIPPVIFAVNTAEDGMETRTCIDGKQRLTSIYRFMDGLIPHKDSITNQKLWYKDNPNTRSRASKRMLPAHYCRVFDNKAVVCVEYEGLKDADEREIFQRVQLGVALTPAEKLKVLKTPRASFVRELQDAFLDDESPLGGDVLAWDRSRGSDFRCLAQTIQCIVMNPKTTSIQATEKWLADPAALAAGFREDIHNTYEVYATLAGDAKYAAEVFRKPGKVAPVEFIAIGMLVHRHKRKLTMKELAGAVGAMRRHVRSVHDDVRNNGKVYKTVVGFIDGYKEKGGGGVGRGEKCAADAAPGGAVVTKKRKRKADDSSDDDDDDDSDDGGGKDYTPARKRPAASTSASTSKPRPTATATSLPTPPVSLPPAPAPPPSHPPPPPPTSQQQAMDVIRDAMERIQSRVALPPAPAPAPPSSASPAPRAWPTTRSASANAGAGAGAGRGQFVALEAALMGGGSGYPSQQQQYQQQYQPNGNANGNGGVSAPPTQPRVKQESPGASGGGFGSGSGRYANTNGHGHGGSARGGYEYDGNGNGSGRDRGWDRERERDSRYWDYNNNSGGGGGGSRGGGGGGAGGRRW